MLKNINNSKSRSTVVYIAHGLNQKISIWDNWIKAIKNTSNYQVSMNQLKGHKPKESLGECRYEDWCKQIENDLSKLFKTKSDIHIIAYSLGALLVLDCLIKNQYKPGKLVLIAPALKPNMFLSLIPSLNENILKNISIPSLSPRHSRVHNAIPLLIYKDIEKAAQRVSDKLSSLRAGKISVYMDNKDELLNTTKTYSCFKNSGLEHQWSQVKSQGSGLGKHHLIPAPGYLAEDIFTEIINDIVRL